MENSSPFSFQTWLTSTRAHSLFEINSQYMQGTAEVAHMVHLDRPSDAVRSPIRYVNIGADLVAIFPYAYRPIDMVPVYYEAADSSVIWGVLHLRTLVTASTVTTDADYVDATKEGILYLHVATNKTTYWRSNDWTFRLPEGVGKDWSNKTRSERRLVTDYGRRLQVYRDAATYPLHSLAELLQPVLSAAAAWEYITCVCLNPHSARVAEAVINTATYERIRDRTGWLKMPAGCERVLHIGTPGMGPAADAFLEKTPLANIRPYVAGSFTTLG